MFVYEDTSNKRSAGPDSSTVRPPLSMDQHLDSAITEPACLYLPFFLKTALTGEFPLLTCNHATSYIKHVRRYLAQCLLSKECEPRNTNSKFYLPEKV